tara:strand:+ start:921 stop:1694 length:774 start_codon:yes stop_codon:yes gene_type:complete
MNGSEIAKSGYDNEYDIVEMFNNWQSSHDAKSMLKEMGYNPEKLPGDDNEDWNISVLAIKIPGTGKSDIKITINGEDKLISAKKYKPDADYNHVARSSVKNYHKVFKFNPLALECLEVFTGERLPSDNPDILIKDVDSIKSYKRANLREIKEKYVESVLEFFGSNVRDILDYIFYGDGDDRPDYMIITEAGLPSKYYLIPMSEVVDFYFGNGQVEMSPGGSLKIGNFITAQRKGGTGGPTNLQFKFKPSAIVKERSC